eukprot:11206989-Lingulodinium_polyedra.AAC.1
MGPSLLPGGLFNAKLMGWRMARKNKEKAYDVFESSAARCSEERTWSNRYYKHAATSFSLAKFGE